MRPIDLNSSFESNLDIISIRNKQPKPRFVLQQSQDSDELAADDKKENSARRGEGMEAVAKKDVKT